MCLVAFVYCQKHYYATDSAYLSATWGRLSVSVSSMRQVDGICQLHKRQDTVIYQLHEAVWLLSVSYMGQVIGVCQ